MKMYWGVANWLPLFLNLALDERRMVRLTPRPFYPRGNNLGTQVGSLVFRAGLWVLEKGRMSCHCWALNRCYSNMQPVVLSLYWLSYVQRSLREPSLLILRRTWGCRGGNYKVYGLLVCDAVCFHVNLPTDTKHALFAPLRKVSHRRTLSLFLVSSAQFALVECSQQLRCFCCSVRRLALTVLSCVTKNFIGNWMKSQKRRFLRAPLISADRSDCNVRLLETENKFAETRFTKQGWPRLVATTKRGQLTRLNTHDSNRAVPALNSAVFNP